MEEKDFECNCPDGKRFFEANGTVYCGLNRTDGINCGAGRFYDSWKGECMDCYPSCKTCTGREPYNCLSCIENA